LYRALSPVHFRGGSGFCNWVHRTEAIDDIGAGEGGDANSDYFLDGRGVASGGSGRLLAEIFCCLAGTTCGDQKIDSGPSSKRKIRVSFAMSARIYCAIDAMLILAPCLALSIACAVAGIGQAFSMSVDSNHAPRPNPEIAFCFVSWKHVIRRLWCA
jgi:hypothetical protein